MLSKILNMIKRGFISNPGDDSDVFCRSQVSSFGNAGNVEMIYPYGMGGLAPKGALVVLFNVGADEGNQIGIAHTPDLRPKGMKEGEAYFGNLLTGSIIIATENGNLNVTVNGDLNMTVNGNVNLTANTVNLDSKVNLGSGGPAIARTGDPVLSLVFPFPPIGTIGTGSSNHTAS